MKKNSFLSHFMIIGSGAFIHMLIGLFTTPLITRIVDPEYYGKASIFNTYTNIVMLIACLGLDQAFIREYYKDESEGYKRKLLRMCSLYPILVFLSLALILCIALVCIFKDAINASHIYIGVCFIINVILLILNRFATLVLRLEKKSKMYAWMDIIHKLTYVLLALVILKTTNFNEFFVLVFSVIISIGLTSLLAMISQRKIWNPFDIKCDRTIEYKPLIQYGAPLLLASGIYMFFQAIDKISLSFFCEYEVVGVYASAMSLMSIIAIIRIAFNTIWAPASIEHYEKYPEDRIFYQRGNRYITVIMFAFALTLMLCKDLIAILLGEKYRSSAMILPFLLFQPMMYTVSETTVVGIYFKKKSYAQLIISGVSCLFNIIGNCILIPLVGAKGAAISTGLSYVLFFTLRTAFSNKYYYVDYGLKKFYFATFITALYALYNTFVEFNIMTVVFYIVIVAIGCFMYRTTLKELIIMLIDKIPMLKKRGKNNV